MDQEVIKTGVKMRIFNDKGIQKCRRIRHFTSICSYLFILGGGVRVCGYANCFKIVIFNKMISDM